MKTALVEHLWMDFTECAYSLHGLQTLGLVVCSMLYCIWAVQYIRLNNNNTSYDMVDKNSLGAVIEEYVQVIGIIAETASDIRLQPSIIATTASDIILLQPNGH